MPFDQEGYVPAPAVKPSHPAPTSSPTVRILIEARAFIKKGWAREPFSIDAKGNKNFGLNDPSILQDGICFCADGALWRVYRGLDDFGALMSAKALLSRYALAAGYPSYIHLNQALDQNGVLAMYDCAIAAAEAQS